jgi:hypothetical protein
MKQNNLSTLYTQKGLESVREQIQNDLACLIDSMGVGGLTNKEGQKIIDLACEIVVDNFKEIMDK